MMIICAGLQKTGTKTMAEALRILGYNVHDVFEQVTYDKQLSKKVLDSTVTREDYQRILGDVDAVMDWPAVAVWEQIMDAFPDAKIILMLRSSEDEWYRRVKNHQKVANKYIIKNDTLRHFFAFHLLMGPIAREFYDLEAAFESASLGVPRIYGSRLPEAFLKSRYRQHNFYVKETCPRDRLLIYRVKEGWKPLCEFLNVDIPNKPFPIANVKGVITLKVMNKNYKYDCGLRKTMERQIITGLIGFMVVLTSFLSYFIYLTVL